MLRLARMFVLPVRRLVEEEFSGASPGLLLAGCALHADFFPESSGSALFAWLLAMLGHHAGYPVPEGGAGQFDRGAGTPASSPAAVTSAVAGESTRWKCRTDGPPPS